MSTSNDSLDLFPVSPLLEWLPDEPLFSLISRIHFLSGRHLSSQTSNILFGGNQSGIHHDFPNCLNIFEQKTQSSLGTAKEIAFNKTLLKYYRAFIPASQAESIIETMQGSSVAHLKFQLGLITSRFRANHPLKACHSCMADDLDQYGWAYWHLEHQFLGVWWCNKHDSPLHESLMKSSGVGRFLWHLPSHETLREYPNSEIEFSDKTAKSILSLSQTAKSLVNTGNVTPWDTNQFWLVYRKELANRGWLTGQRLSYPEMTSDFLNYSAKLRLLPEFKALPETIKQAKAQLGRLLRAPRSGTHPLRHIILIDWLFGGTDQFLNTKKISSAKTEECASPDFTFDITKETNKDPQEGLVIQLLHEQDLSMNSVAKLTGIDINIIMSWAANAGLNIHRRPKKVKGDILDELIMRLRQGVVKATLASQTSVSIVTINRLLRTVPGLQTEWKIAHFNLALNKARTTWSSLFDQYPQLGTKLLRSLEPAIYTWLYRHDRDWLREHSPHAEHPIEFTGNNAMWDKRDLALSTEVKRAALYLTQTNPHARIYLWQLYQQVPELKAKLEVLHRLPLTKRAIDAILAHPSPHNRSFDLI